MIEQDTIFALSTSETPGGIAVVRISGPQARQAMALCFHRPKGGDCVPRMLTYGHVMDGETPIDECMAVFLPAPHTYTREDIVELQCHGAPAVIEQILALLGRLPLGLRPAAPGEFTRRAYENGRIDLARAEAVMDLIAAQSRAGARRSLQQLSGSLSASILSLHDTLVEAIAAVDAGIDFPEDDWEQEANQRGFMLMQSVREKIAELLGSYSGGRLVQNGVRCAIVGRPNVGKSSFLNAAAGFERALVSEQAGTTRDMIELALSVNGMAITLMDTAGVRSDASGLERLGMDLNVKHIQAADVVIFVADGSAPLTEDDRLVAQSLPDVPVVVALNKADLGCVLSEDDFSMLGGTPVFVPCCARSGEGVSAVLEAVLEALPLPSDGVGITNARHADALERALALLDRATNAYAAGEFADMAAMYARDALACLDEILGYGVEESVVDRIFSAFCVGK
ncbi:MAG: tRNA uridine-5-carboxymethylaminomethyl(34) synthesis GTPase MnmE [Clostridia bacterium]|nr:tRNA uridine-5-carboxymethylaminomethyl(34) synthesis GTPase MnmE [Clostridia bacterium]